MEHELEQELKNNFDNFRNLNNPNIEIFVDTLLSKILKYDDIRIYDISKKTVYKDNKPYFVTLEGGPDELFLKLMKSDKNIKYGLKISRKIHSNFINIKIFNNEKIIHIFDIYENNIQNDIKPVLNLPYFVN